MSIATASSMRFAPSQPISRDEIPLLDFEMFRGTLLDECESGGRIVALLGNPQQSQSVRLIAVVAQASTGTLSAYATQGRDRYPALTPDLPQVHWFEREIAEQWGLVPEGHPWLKPIRFHRSYRGGHDAWSRTLGDDILPCVGNFFRVNGEEVHEVAVGPVHAGVIEPGHFRFQCHGEIVYHLEVSLGYQHRGVEPALVGGPNKRTIKYMETLAGDTSIGHASAYCQNIEALCDCQVPLRAQALRAVMLELERLANHTGDLGALAQDVGFLPTSNYCGRLRGDFLNATAHVCGSRFGRDMVRPGGVMFDVDQRRADELIERLSKALDDVKGAANLLWETLTVQARFEDTCPLPQAAAAALGIVGVVARASGIDMDVRRDFPSGMFRFAQIPVSVADSCDVFARAYVRFLEVQRSGDFVLRQLREMPPGEIRVSPAALAPNSIAVSLVEGWRGEICHVALTDDSGQFEQYKVIDPSFHNWVGMMIALRNQQISDFPLCNKSFNLSYCGHDL